MRRACISTSLYYSTNIIFSILLNFTTGCSGKLHFFTTHPPSIYRWPFLYNQQQPILKILEKKNTFFLNTLQVCGCVQLNVSESAVNTQTSFVTNFKRQRATKNKKVLFVQFIKRTSYILEMPKQVSLALNENVSISLASQSFF